MKVPILITFDIHCYQDTQDDLPQWLEGTLKILDELSIKATFFFPAVFAEQFAGQARDLLKAGHEIGCHGLTHGPEEQFSQLHFKKQKAVLSEAKLRIEQVCGTGIVSFRAPLFKINGDTVRALEESGFRADLSVNPQRLGILSSDFQNSGWLLAPRYPYHPDYRNPFRKGKSLIWEIPQSAFLLPFMSNTGIAFGRNLMNLFFEALYRESRIKKNPIVYMLHPEDIFPRKTKYQYKFKFRDLVPSKKHGFVFRFILLSNKDGFKVSRQIVDLLKFMKRHKNIEFLTVKQTIDRMEKNRQT